MADESVARVVAPVRGRADVAALVIEGTEALGATLVRYSAEGENAGDIWYGSAEEAQSCAARDYGAALGPWQPVPAAEPNAADYALRLARAVEQGGGR
jgi:hypothetical protein